MLSRGKIRKRIGLWLSAKYNAHHGRNLWPTHGERRSGRTTDLVVSAIDSLQRKRPVVIIAYSREYADNIVKQVLDYCRILGLRVPMLAIRGLSMQEHKQKRRMLVGCVVLQDHFSGDHRAAYLEGKRP